ncbi:uncharacterized protein BT62DRAFT_1004149 [Guyanagaster necrorhizus]|uniref:Uncharacterized protein n=1 Tax=Guyanagaster necrorhizus TaxID=856835 RepID=A0A9P7VVM0_9AGAR|nr:uncharacterized protein BT62DRAFT_1004149 [Guyanagaster necrorhizus MCA 3950]KAG7448351.1 hypothetical protein BT62DRAFT_1004149 [Guyanagaster necrorhizus MCA 3950]
MADCGDFYLWKARRQQRQAQLDVEMQLGQGGKQKHGMPSNLTKPPSQPQPTAAKRSSKNSVYNHDIQRPARYYWESR